MHELLAPPLENARVLALATSMAYLQNSVPPNLALARSLSKQMRTLPPGGWHRPEGVDDPLSVLRHLLRYREPPVTALHPKPHRSGYAVYDARLRSTVRSGPGNVEVDRPRGWDIARLFAPAAVTVSQPS